MAEQGANVRLLCRPILVKTLCPAVKQPPWAASAGAWSPANVMALGLESKVNEIQLRWLLLR